MQRPEMRYDPSFLGKNGILGDQDFQRMVTGLATAALWDGRRAPLGIVQAVRRGHQASSCFFYKLNSLTMFSLIHDVKI